MSSIAVVILDDDAFLLKVLQRTIHRAYPEVDIMTTSDIDEFWQLLNTKQDLDLVLSDYLMPQMNGLDLATSLKADERFKNKPILVLTTESSPAMKAKGKEIGVTGWMVKPFSDDKLVKAVKMVLGI